MSEILGNVDDALFAYEQALRANPNSIPAMNSISAILRTREDFVKAIDYLNNILKIDNSNGEAWGSLGKSNSALGRLVLHGLMSCVLTSTPGHCYLMMDDLQQAYAAYQNALINLRNPKVRSDYLTAAHETPHSLIASYDLGTQAMVRHWYSLRPLWLLGPCRGGLLSGHADATRFRESQRNLLPPWNYIQATAEVQSES